MQRPMPCGGTGASEAARDPGGRHANEARPSRSVKCVRRAMLVMLVLRRAASLAELLSALHDALQALQPAFVYPVVEVRHRLVILSGRRRVDRVGKAPEVRAPLH